MLVLTILNSENIHENNIWERANKVWKSRKKISTYHEKDKVQDN